MERELSLITEYTHSIRYSFILHFILLVYEIYKGQLFYIIWFICSILCLIVLSINYEMLKDINFNRDRTINILDALTTLLIGPFAFFLIIQEDGTIEEIIIKRMKRCILTHIMLNQILFSYSIHIMIRAYLYQNLSMYDYDIVFYTLYFINFVYHIHCVICYRNYQL